MIKEFSAGLIVFFQQPDKDREYLLLHYQSGHWDFPKGHIENDESKKEAAKRELKEETNLEAHIIDGFEESLSYFHHLPKTNELAFKVVCFFVGVVKEKNVQLSHEHIDYAWMPYDKALKKLTYDNAKEMLKKVETFLNNQKAYK
ncbi:MAG: NUDIX domain-containing protein [Candidatus Babeliales bacterium]